MALENGHIIVNGLSLGNKCGHFPKNPRFYQKTDNYKYRYSAIEYAIEALKRSYTEPTKLMKKLLCHVNNKDRIRRSERREAIISVSQLFLSYTDSKTLFVRVPTANGHKLFLDLKWIAEKVNMKVIRVRRAIMCMVKAGYLEIKRQYNTASIKRIAAQFFIDLGVKQEKLFEMKAFKEKREELNFVSSLRAPQAGAPILSDILKGVCNQKVISNTKPAPVQLKPLQQTIKEPIKQNTKLEARSTLPDYEHKKILQIAIERYHENKNRSIIDHTEDLYKEYFAKRGVEY